MEMIIAFLFGLATMFIYKIIRKPKEKSENWKLLFYKPYIDTSFGDRVSSCKFTVINETNKKVYNRISYGKQYSQSEIAQALTLGVAHKLGEDSYV